MQKDFTTGRIGRKLLLLAGPIVFSMLLQTAYNIVDTVFIGMLGPENLAAISITFPVVFVFIAVASGFAVGSNALVSQALGQNDENRASNFAEHSLLLSLAAGIAIAILGIVFSKHLFVFMGASGKVLELTIAYSNLIFVGFVFLFLGFVSQSLIQGEGDSKTPMKNLFYSVMLNIALDPLLIFGFAFIPAFGIVGAAIATVLSRSVAAFLNIYHLLSGKGRLKLKPTAFKFNAGILKKIIAIGLPSSISQSITAAGFMFITSFVSAFGTFAIAAYGIGMRLNSMVVLPMIGIATATITFVGQNIGAGNVERAKSVVWFSAKISFAITAPIVFFMLLFPKYFFIPFTQSSEIIEIGIEYLSIIAWTFLLFSIYYMIISGFQGAGKTMLSLATNLVYWAVAIALAAVLPATFGLVGIWYALAIAIIIEVLLSLAVFLSGIWTEKAI